MIEIRYANGNTDATETLEDALKTVTAEYPGAVFVDHHGDEVLFADEDAECRLRQEGGRILVWRSEEASRYDAGGKTIASLRLI